MLSEIWLEKNGSDFENKGGTTWCPSLLILKFKVVPPVVEIVIILPSNTCDCICQVSRLYHY